MPALRKSSRKSRTSTPYATPTDIHSPPSEARKEKAQTSLDTWVEPPPKAPAPSFEDHGFARHGLFETMAALGVPPSSKVKQRARALPEPITRRSLPAKNGNLLGADEVVSTPEMTPAPELERDGAEPLDEEEMSSELPPQQLDEDDDDDYVPAKSKAKAHTSKTPVRGKTPAQGKTPTSTKIQSKNAPNHPTAIKHNTALQNLVAVTADSSANVNKQRLQIIINDAVARSRADNKPVIGAALQQLHEESLKSFDVRAVLDSMLRQSPTKEQLEAFRRYIKDAKKRIKRETTNAHGSQPALGSRVGSHVHSTPFSPSSSPFSAKPKKAVSAANPTEPARTIEDGSDPNSTFSDTTDVVTEDVQRAHLNSRAAMGRLPQPPPHPFSTAPALAKRSPSPALQHMPSKSPRKLDETNGSAVREVSTGAVVEAPSKAPSPDAPTPDSIIAALSDSDLSDVNEEIVQNGPPEPLKANGKSATVAPTVKRTHAAPLRAGKKSRANSAKPNGRYEKKAPPTAEELAEEAELRRRREEMALQQPARQDYNPQTSEIRFEDDLLDTESLTESQIALGPPIDTDASRRAVRGSRTGLTLGFGKRFRDGNSALPSSPLVGSAPSTRPSTPAFAAPAAKRIKLNNGQAARTKRSPVKNRDGPIAGIAHGGASRQLGPDDNDQGSPPSESDDFCSACKGAGEFVCCENCPRVYHFLCCDPPLLAPPDEEFLCHECETKVKQANEPTFDGFTVLRPLFKQLDFTNTQSFALPSDVQNYFEGVSARKDGSYGEEVKKFPLAKSSGYGYQRPDYLKTHDADHKPILCVQCGKSSAGKRQMLKCDFCDAYWHLDCCDPPLANPPPINLESSSREAWKCPRHVDHDFRSGQLLQNDLNASDGDDVAMLDVIPGGLVARKVRRPKHPSVVEPTFSRGIRNNGLIDIINDPDDETDGEGNYVFASLDSRDPNSKIYRLTEKGIITDFLSKVKENRAAQYREERRAAKAAAKRTKYRQQFAARPIEQQQAALHLAQLANKEADIGMNETTVDALCLSLTAEAPQQVVDGLSKAGPGPMTEAKRAELLKLRELIDRALGN